MIASIVFTLLFFGIPFALSCWFAMRFLDEFNSGSIPSRMHSKASKRVVDFPHHRGNAQ
jgi:hypothetical protein